MFILAPLHCLLLHHRPFLPGLYAFVSLVVWTTFNWSDHNGSAELQIKDLPQVLIHSFALPLFLLIHFKYIKLLKSGDTRIFIPLLLYSVLMGMLFFRQSHVFDPGKDTVAYLSFIIVFLLYFAAWLIRRDVIKFNPPNVVNILICIVSTLCAGQLVLVACLDLNFNVLEGWRFTFYSVPLIGYPALWVCSRK